MPELPEVETMCRGIRPLVGSRVSAVLNPHCQAKPLSITPGWAAFGRKIVGQVISGVSRQGKCVVVEFHGKWWIVLEPRMTGLVLLGTAEPPSRQHLRFGLQLNSPENELWFWDRRGLGSVRLLDPPGWEAFLKKKRHGPDALRLSEPELRDRLSCTRRPLKVALLDQSLLAGVGNLYASEILHLAGIHPERTADSLTPAQWSKLHAALVEILQLAVEREGSTLGDGTYRNTLSQAGGYQNLHRVYDRAGELCPSCGKSPITRMVQAQRATFFCAACQILPRTRAGKTRPTKQVQAAEQASPAAQVQPAATKPRSKAGAMRAKSASNQRRQNSRTNRK